MSAEILPFYPASSHRYARFLAQSIAQTLPDEKVHFFIVRQF